jgi:arylsulfatase A
MPDLALALGGKNGPKSGMRPFSRLFLNAVLLAATFGAGTAPAAEKPNIVYILADDLGYGDVKAFNPEGKIPTPRIDRLASEGIRFTDAHTGSAVCTPTRYGILTGRYAWRSKLKNGVLGGFSPPLIHPERATVASFLKKEGYRTACMGKWHLGWDWARTGATPETEPKNYGAMPVDYAKPIQNGPTRLGFDVFFGISASLDMPPYIYIDGDRTVGVPTVEKSFKVPARRGPAHVDFEAEDVLPDVTERAVKFVTECGHDADRKPFFLYVPLNSPHTPIVPKAEFIGKSGVGEYGDFVCQSDWAVGRIVDALEDNGLTENTLVIVTSDNGCSPQADFPALAKLGHHPSFKFRGHKADIYEGGHRVAFVAKWPGKIAAASTSDQTICLTDLFATVAEITETPVPPDAAEDSVSLLPALLGKAEKPLREATVHHSINGSFAIRQGDWKLCLCPGSGGWSDPKPGKATKGMPPVQLFDLTSDIGETMNVAADHPHVVKALTELLQKYVDQGRSTPGAPQENEGAVRISRDE